MSKNDETAPNKHLCIPENGSKNDLLKDYLFHDQSSFQSIDLINFDGIYGIEGATVDQDKNIDSQLFNNNNIPISLQNPFLTSDEFMLNNITGHTCDANTYFQDQDSNLLDEFYRLDILSDVSQVKPIFAPTPIMNESDNNKLEIVNQKIIKNDPIQLVEDEINSSPQIIHKSPCMKRNQFNFNEFKIQCSKILANSFQQKSSIFYKKVNNHETKKRKNFSKDQKKVLLNFIEQHKDNPYINNENLRQISEETGLSDKQIRIFLTNYRVRNSCSQKKRPRRSLNNYI